MSKKLTIEDIKAKLPSHITIDEFTYVNVTTKARFIDSEYGEWEALPLNVTRGSGHPKRGKASALKKTMLTIEEIKARLPSHITLDESTYINAHTSARFIDSEYGEWQCKPNNIFNGKGHPKRGRELAAKKTMLAIEEIKARLPSHITLDESTYVNVTIKAKFIDSEYGEWWARPDAVFRGGNHPKRASSNGASKITLSVDVIKSRLPSHITLDESTYVNVTTKARFIDSEYGEWWALPDGVSRGKRSHPMRGKQVNADKRRLTADEVKAQLPSHITLDESTYVDTKTKARFIDSEYGEWWTTPNKISQGGNHPRRYGKRSRGEEEVGNFVTSLGLQIELNKRFNYDSKGFEIDVFIPSKNIGIEYNGLYWHSDEYRHNNYHLEKREYFKKQGVTLLQFMENEWRDKRLIVESIIKSKLGLSQNKYYARKLTLKQVPSKEAQQFLTDNHLMGVYKSAKHVGLYSGDELVTICSYKKYKDGIDISRFCNKLNTSVAGSLSKLLKHIEETESPKFIQSFVDLRYGQGDSLTKLGFELKGTTLGWSWADDFNIYNRLKCRANMDSRNLSEKQHAEELGWFKVYDAGQAKYIKLLSQS